MSTTIDKSSAIKSALHEGFKSGTSGMTKRKCFGYTHDVDGSLVIHPEEAQIVSWIFECFLAGKATWSKEAISKLLSNEKYTGRVLFQKTISVAGIQTKNEGFEDRYLYQKAHEAIISDELFEHVQALKQGASIVLQFS